MHPMPRNGIASCGVLEASLMAWRPLEAEDGREDSRANKSPDGVDGLRAAVPF